MLSRSSPAMLASALPNFSTGRYMAKNSGMQQLVIDAGRPPDAVTPAEEGVSRRLWPRPVRVGVDRVVRQIVGRFGPREEKDVEGVNASGVCDVCGPTAALEAGRVEPHSIHLQPGRRGFDRIAGRTPGPPIQIRTILDRRCTHAGPVRRCHVSERGCGLIFSLKERKHGDHVGLC
eukprot:3650247-Rhodomonas_salina.3